MKFFCFTALTILLFSNSGFSEEVILKSTASVDGAPQMEAILNDSYLMAYAISRGDADGKYSEDVKIFLKKAKSIGALAFRQLRGYANIGVETTNNSIFSDSFKDYLSKLEKLPEYQKIRTQTLNYMKDSVVEWDNNLKTSFEFVKKYSGYSFNYNFKVYITHPAIHNGQEVSGQEKLISFGAWPTFKNYFTVYMWHENLHFQVAENHTGHSVIQLLTDNDLRVYLNHEKLRPLQGHPYLFPEMEKLMPKWEAYKKAPTNLNAFITGISFASTSR